MEAFVGNKTKVVVVRKRPPCEADANNLGQMGNTGLICIRCEISDARPPSRFCANTI